jgi:hypothetical protein
LFDNRAIAVKTQMLNELSPLATKTLLSKAISEDVGMMVGRMVKGELEQLAMIDKIKKSGLVNNDDIEELIARSVDEGLERLNINEAHPSVAQMFYKEERGAIQNDLIRSLEEEVHAAERSMTRLAKKENGKTTRQYEIDQNVKTQNEELIKLIKEHGDIDGQLANRITDEAKSLRANGAGDLARITKELSDEFRKQLDEGAYDGILLRRDIIDRAITKEINSSKELRDTPGVKIEKFSDGARSKASQDKATQDLQTLEQRIADNPNLANQRLHYATWDDLKQDYVTTEKSLGDVIAETKANRNVIDLLKNCKL